MIKVSYVKNQMWIFCGEEFSHVFCVSCLFVIFFLFVRQFLCLKYVIYLFLIRYICCLFVIDIVFVLCRSFVRLCVGFFSSGRISIRKIWTSGFLGSSNGITRQKLRQNIRITSATILIHLYPFRFIKYCY